tara:strand:+ start:10922 stop:11794 length:873 start_codon:yes stop_codon:yes gene_type:complete
MKNNIYWKMYKYSIDSLFFKEWSSEMAYILGFSCADGNVYKTTLSWDLAKKYESNKSLLEDFNRVLKSNYPIVEKKNSFRLSIHNRIIIEDIKKLGIIPNKKKILIFPNVPNDFLKDFIRGFLDGDGWITIRSRGENLKEISIGFSNGSKSFMEDLIYELNQKVSLSSNNLRLREKITPKGIKTKCYQVEYYSKNAFNILDYLYGGLKPSDLFLERKYFKQLEARKIYIRFSRTSRKWRMVEDKFGMDMEEIFFKLVNEKQLNGVEIGRIFGVHSSSVYRWLEKIRKNGY